MSEDKPLEQRAQRALRGEEPWEPIMEKIHTFVRGDLDAEIAALTERLRAVEAERDALRRATGDNRKGDAVDEITLLKRELSALRAELERKDAALREVPNLRELYCKACDEWQTPDDVRDKAKGEIRRIEAACAAALRSLDTKAGGA